MERAPADGRVHFLAPVATSAALIVLPVNHIFLWPFALVALGAVLGRSPFRIGALYAVPGGVLRLLDAASGLGVGAVPLVVSLAVVFGVLSGLWAVVGVFARRALPGAARGV